VPGTAGTAGTTETADALPRPDRAERHVGAPRDAYAPPAPASTSAFAGGLL
jgi:hypothetical protein